MLSSSSGDGPALDAEATDAVLSQPAEESCNSPESSGLHPWSLLSGGSAEPPTVFPSAPEASDGDLGSEALSQDAGWVHQPGDDAARAPADSASFAAYLESLLGMPRSPLMMGLRQRSLLIVWRAKQSPQLLRLCFLHLLRLTMS